MATVEEHTVIEKHTVCDVCGSKRNVTPLTACLALHNGGETHGEHVFDTFAELCVRCTKRAEKFIRRGMTPAKRKDGDDGAR